MRFLANSSFVLFVFVLSSLVSCSGGGGDSFGSGRGGSDAANFDCDGNCPNQNLSVDDVTRIVRQAVAAAEQLGVAATVVVLDRPANVLAAYQMAGAQTTSVVTSGTGVSGGLEGATVPAVYCAISKAGVASYFSSQANAFNTRTANQLLAENFLIGEFGAPSGPLFGVQFSQGLCSDVNTINPDTLGFTPAGKSIGHGLVGPRPLPLGFAADPGSVTLYKNGDLVGSVAIEADGIYTRDNNLLDIDDNLEERIALTASIGFESPSERVASTVFVRGKTLRFTDINYSDLAPLPDPLPELEAGRLLNVPGFTTGEIRRGSVFGTAESGFVRTTRGGLEVEVVVDDAGTPRFPTRSGAALPGGVELTATEVDALLTASVLVADRTRSQIRKPGDSSARVAVYVVDTLGDVVGFVRSKDTILDSTDVTLQKTRTALFFSAPDAAEKLIAAGQGEYVSATRALIGNDAFTGNYAWSTTALGNIARPTFPDGIPGNPTGPLSLPVLGTPGASRAYSIFNTGLQLDIYIAALTTALSDIRALPDSCTDRRFFGNRLRDGAQFFAGAFPLYRGTTLIGAISSSGDGTEQDDLIPFYAASRVGLDEAGFAGVGDARWGFNAPEEIRADRIPLSFPQTQLRYVACPEGPFIASNVQDACGGL